MDEKIDPTDVLAHPERYLMDGDPISAVVVMVKSADVKGFTTKFCESGTNGWGKYVTRKPRTRKVKARAYRYKDEPRPALVITEEEGNWITADIVWIGQEFEIEVEE